MQQPLKTHLFSKHNGQLDFLFRFAQVEIAAVGDGHAQLIEYAVRQLRIDGAVLMDAVTGECEVIDHSSWATFTSLPSGP